MPKHNLAARAGRWSAQHRRKAILGWLFFVIACTVLGGAIGKPATGGQGSTVGDSGRADALVEKRFPARAQESVLIQSRVPGGARSAEVRTAVTDVITAITGLKAVADVRSPYDPGSGQVSKDGRSVVVQFELHAPADRQAALITPVEKAVAAVSASHPAVRIGQFGSASADKALEKSFADDFAKAEKLSVPITLVILVLAFGALAAAGIPLLLALTAVVATLGLVAIPGLVIDLDPTVQSIVLLVGMAVGVDYTLFYLRREREERRKGASPADALAIAAATSGRSVIVSGLTVMAAMAGLLFAGDSTFISLGIGSVLVVGVAMLGSVTVLPAILSALGDRVDKGRIPFAARLRRDDGESRLWGAIVSRVLARPLLSAGLSLGVLVALAIPALGMHTADSGTDSLPRALPVMQVFDRLQAAFPGKQIPITVVVKADDVSRPAVVAQIDALRKRAVATPQMSEPVTISVSPDRTVAALDIPTLGEGDDAVSREALRVLREDIVPATVGTSGAAQAYVSGYAAGSKDFNDLMKQRAPIVIAFVLSLAFVLLLVTFRSIVVPMKAIVLNLLSVAASYGVLVLVFQDGHGEGLLGFSSTGSITSWLPMFLFVILFGLSMDYHVLILSRIREAFDGGMTSEEAVAYGIKRTAGVVTSAAAVMIAVFAIFATLSNIDFKMMGVGLATAILIDATLVRGVLLPATMQLLGDRNWYLPARLSWLPRWGEAPKPAAV
ncbi:MAG TPA: MMPL family transporter [Solirubrobacteraceae bacterium]|jgi:RND superfamily putative drug exporter